jgi:hypothetical protein
MGKKAVSLILAVLVGLFFAASPVHGKKASLTDIVVTNTRDDLLIYFTVNNCFTPQMNTAIESGINTTFTFYIKLYEKRTLLWDKVIAQAEISHSIRYDQLKNVYEVKLSESNGKMRVVKSFDEAKKLMAEVTALKLTPIENLHKGGRYQVAMMAELEKVKLPLYLHYVLFFVSLWDFKTGWETMDFRY